MIDKHLPNLLGFWLCSSDSLDASWDASDFRSSFHWFRYSFRFSLKDFLSVTKIPHFSRNIQSDLQDFTHEPYFWYFSSFGGRSFFLSYSSDLSSDTSSFSFLFDANSFFLALRFASYSSLLAFFRSASRFALASILSCFTRCFSAFLSLIACIKLVEVSFNFSSSSCFSSLSRIVSGVSCGLKIK